MSCRDDANGTSARNRSGTVSTDEDTFPPSVLRKQKPKFAPAPSGSLSFSSRGGSQRTVSATLPYSSAVVGGRHTGPNADSKGIVDKDRLEWLEAVNQIKNEVAEDKCNDFTEYPVVGVTKGTALWDVSLQCVWLSERVNKLNLKCAQMSGTIQEIRTELAEVKGDIQLVQNRDILKDVCCCVMSAASDHLGLQQKNTLSTTVNNLKDSVSNVFDWSKVKEAFGYIMNDTKFLEDTGLLKEDLSDIQSIQQYGNPMAHPLTSDRPVNNYIAMALTSPGGVDSVASSYPEKWQASVRRLLTFYAKILSDD